MNNKKLSRLLEPNLKLYFLCMVLFCCATAVVSPLLALAEAAVIVALYAYFTKANQKRRQGILQYIDSLTGSVDTASKSTLINSPLPIMCSGRTPARSSGAMRTFCSWPACGNTSLK